MAGWTDRIWSRRYQAILVSGEEAAQIDRVAKLIHQIEATAVAERAKKGVEPLGEREAAYFARQVSARVVSSVMRTRFGRAGAASGGRCGPDAAPARTAPSRRAGRGGLAEAAYVGLTTV